MNLKNRRVTFAFMLLKKIVQNRLLQSLALAAVSVLLHFWAFHQTPFATGWDSYFYLVQVKSLEETGTMHSPEASLIYPYLQVFYWFTGDYVLGMKIGVALLCGIFTLLVCRRGAAFPLLGAWSLFSPQLTYFAAQYPKNLLGLVLFVAFIRALDWAMSKSRSWLALPAFLLIANYFGHRMMFGLAVVYALLWLLFRYKNQIPRMAIKIGIALGGAFGLFLLAGQFFPGLAQVADLARLSGTLSWQPQFAPWSFVQSFGLERIGGWWIFEIAMVVFWWLAGIATWKSGKSVSNPALFWLCGLLLFPFLEWSLTGLAWRMFLVFVVLLPLAFDFQNVPQKTARVLFPTLLVCSMFSWKSYSPALQDPDYALFQKVTNRAMNQLLESPAPSKPELFIAHNALAEYFTFTTGTDAMPWLPEYTIDSTKLWRIAAGVHGQTLRYFAGTENALKIKDLGGRYFLLPEYVWQLALKNARKEDDVYFLETAESWLNPHSIRPAFLLKRKQGG